MRNQTKLAEIVSAVSHPALVVVVALAIITSHYAGSTEQFWRWTVIAAILLLLPGTIYTAYTWKKEGKVDVDVTRREDRIIPLLLATVGAMIGEYLIAKRLNSHSLLIFANTLVGTLILLTVITSVWKISLHAATLTAVASLVIIFRGEAFLWLYLLILPVAWARLQLKQHTPLQLIAGSILGIVITFFSAFLFRR